MAGRQMSWLLALIAGSSPDDDLLDPIRIQKGIFLLQQDGVIPKPDRYKFMPYNYGPAAFGIYDDIRLLQADGLVIEQPSERHSYQVYRATPAGRKRAEGFLGSLPADVAARVMTTRSLVAGKEFRELLEYVYSRYPKYAEKSVVSL